MQNAKVTTETPPSKYLRTKYYCTVDRGKKMDVVMQLSCSELDAVEAIQYRYVLVIDVSGSMGWTMPGSKLNLLDRIKVFAETFVEHMNKDSFLSIVTFSHEANTRLEMTRMNDLGKKTAQNIIEGLIAEGGTNLSEGIFEGLRTTKRRFGQKQTRDCIILFTDGEANNGIKDPSELVLQYNKLFRNKKSRVPISAFTIGSYRPYLLHEIALQLGCDAFYWLNEDVEIEVNLFLPICLREQTFITDINVHLTCLEGVTFESSAISKQFLQTKVGSDHPKELTYFVHSIPGKLKKHIPMVLNIPEESELDGKKILKVQTTFLDFHLQKHDIFEYLELSLKTMRKLPSHSKQESSQQAVDILQSTSAYCVTGSKADISWLSAQEAFAKVYHEKCRVITAESLNGTCELLKQETVDIPQVKSQMKGAINGIEKLKNAVSTTLGSENRFSRQLRKDAEEMKITLDFGKGILSGDNWSRLASMQSAISAEMPPATGVFNPSKPHPYMSSRVSEDLQKHRKVVKKKAVLRRQKQIKIFKAQYMALSEDLLQKRIGPKKESFEEHIIAFGGTAVPHVGTMLNDTILISTKRDFDRKSLRVRDAMNSKVPVLKETFIHDCIKDKKILKMDDYILAK